ncbi:MAG: hypothetical protein APU95_00455 [Hadesarchaea archaeon YNP_N21]|nr:MAG: hypothetical protein APU95_00455 [Hadesarchaea archaeon YNP_N21]
MRAHDDAQQAKKVSEAARNSKGRVKAQKKGDLTTTKNRVKPHHSLENCYLGITILSVPPPVRGMGRLRSR